MRFSCSIPQGRVATWNAGAERIKGYRADEIIGQHFSRFYTQEDIEHGKPERELKIAASEGRLEEEGWRVRKDGSRFWANVIITAIRDNNGELLGFSKVTRDFTERKKDRGNVHLSEQRFRSLFEFSPDAILVTDQDGKITEANSQVEKFSATNARNCLGQPIEMLVPERFRAAHPSHRKEYNDQPGLDRWESAWNFAADAKMARNFRSTSCSVLWRPGRQERCSV